MLLVNYQESWWLMWTTCFLQVTMQPEPRLTEWARSLATALLSWRTSCGVERESAALRMAQSVSQWWNITATCARPRSPLLDVVIPTQLARSMRGGSSEPFLEAFNGWWRSSGSTCLHGVFFAECQAYSANPDPCQRSGTSFSAGLYL